MTTQEVWDKAAKSILPTKPTIPGLAMCLHPKMVSALGKFGWEAVAKRETLERKESLKAWCGINGIEYGPEEFLG